MEEDMEKEITLKDIYLGRADGSQEAEDKNFENQGKDNLVTGCLFHCIMLNVGVLWKEIGTEYMGGYEYELFGKIIKTA